MLNQLGYRAKIGRKDCELITLIAFQQVVYNTLYFTNSKEEGIIYSVVDLKQRELSGIHTCSMDYGGAQNNLDMRITKMPQLSVSQQTKVLREKTMLYNKNIVDFCASYPCVEFSVYAEAAMDDILLESIEEHLSSQIKGLSQEDAVNRLLHFVQNAFEYKTDEQQFGYEKWSFSEETIAS
jgi:hypothetical protein